MDRLTVDHSYDPETGFIVAREVIELPTVIVEGPTLPEAIDRGRDESKLLIVFATADRCAPCQQYKKSALNDARVIDRLGGAGVLVTHVEVDREPELAEELLGSRAIPMTYAFRDGERVAMLRGQRSAEELLDWLDEQRESADG
ncbi:MAG: thioredoxin family protein [Planctomycetota bacterium]